MSARPCAEVRPLLSEHLEGELPADTDAAVRAHLAECAPCRARLELLRRTVGALRGLPELPAPAGILAGVRGRLRPAPWHRRLTRGRPWLLGVPVGALATLLVVVGVALFQARFPELRAPGDEAPADRTPAPAPSATPEPPPVPTPAVVPERALPAPPPARPPASPASPAAREAAPLPAEKAERPRAAEREEAAPPTRFVIPEPEAVRPPTPWRPTPRPPERAAAPEGPGLRPAGGREGSTRETFLPQREEAAGGPPQRDVVVQPRGGDLPSRGSRLAVESARRPAPFDDGRAPTVGGGPPSRSVAGSGGRVAQPEGGAARIALALPRDADVEEIRRLVLRAEGVILATRALDPGASAAERRRRLRDGAPGAATVWEITARLPGRALPRLLEALERRRGVRILERPALPAAGDEAPVEVRISVLR